MDRINSNLQEILQERWAKAQLAREALKYSALNNRITMEIFMLESREEIDPLLVERTQNTETISHLGQRIRERIESEKERELLDAVDALRWPYINSYKQALHLLIDEQKPAEARAAMVKVTLPLLVKYHDAWDAFVQFQGEQMHRELERELAERKRAEAQLADRARELDQLSELGDLLQSCQETEEAYKLLAHGVQELFPLQSGALFVISPSRNLVEAVAVWGPCPPVERVFAPADCWALRRGGVHIVRRSDSAVSCPHLGKTPLVGSLCVPMMARGEALGVLHLQTTSQTQGEPLELPKDRMEADQRLAVTVAVHTALALANLNLRETLRNQSIRDPLTGLFNRRFMEESLEREVHRAIRNQQSVAVVMMDIDHFKRFNDTFGHQAGDTLLRAFGDFLKKRTRGQDLACRYGGEEFALVLSGASSQSALERAKILLEEVKELKALHGGQLLGAISLSLGVAAFPEHGSTIEEILHAADQALYRAKMEGRDRVIVSEFVP